MNIFTSTRAAAPLVAASSQHPGEGGRQQLTQRAENICFSKRACVSDQGDGLDRQNKRQRFLLQSRRVGLRLLLVLRQCTGVIGQKTASRRGEGTSVASAFLSKCSECSTSPLPYITHFCSSRGRKKKEGKVRKGLGHFFSHRTFDHSIRDDDE